MTRSPTEALEEKGFDGVAVLALGYLAVPNLIFILGWFQLPIAFALGLTLSYLLFNAFRTSSISWQSDFAPTTALLIAGAAFAWAAFAGGSHFMFSPHDWAIRDAVLGDLVYGEWPPAYQSADDAQSHLLRSALGYFLAPAIAGKLFGTSGLGMAVYLWTAVGVSLFFLLLPFPGHAIGRLIPAIAIVICFSGTDILGYLVSTGEFPEFPGRIEWWGPYSYSSMSGQLLWAPNHAIPIWLTTALLYRYRDSINLARLLLALLPLTLIWTPFASLGILPFVVMVLLRKARSFHDWRISWKHVAMATIYSLPIILFLTIDIAGISHGPQGSGDPSTVATRAPLSNLLDYCLFVSIEVGLIAVALLPHASGRRDLFCMAVLVLVFLPFFSYGPSNDAALRLSGPALTILAILCIETVVNASPNGLLSLQSGLLWLVLAIGANTAINELARAALFPHWVPNYTISLGERQGGIPAPHYAGRLSSRPFLEFLLKEARRVPEAAARR